MRGMKPKHRAGTIGVSGSYCVLAGMTLFVPLGYDSRP